MLSHVRYLPACRELDHARPVGVELRDHVRQSATGSSTCRAVAPAVVDGPLLEQAHDLIHVTLEPDVEGRALP
jgi:hypothetical protein